MLSPHTIGAKTREDWPALQAHLDAGQPTVLVVVKEKGVNLAKLGLNHQVLATGYRYEPLVKDLTVFIYDPNHADEEHSLYVSLGLPESQLDATASAPGFTFRGFFMNTSSDAAAA